MVRALQSDALFYVEPPYRVGGFKRGFKGVSFSILEKCDCIKCLKLVKDGAACRPLWFSSLLFSSLFF